MFFMDPAQLLAVYQELEESNLFYIQNAQVLAVGTVRTKYLAVGAVGKQLGENYAQLQLGIIL